jgi:hypothetical protein
MGDTIKKSLTGAEEAGNNKPDADGSRLCGSNRPTTGSNCNGMKKAVWQQQELASSSSSTTTSLVAGTELVQQTI